MAAQTGVEPGTPQSKAERRLSWPIFLFTLAAVTSSSLSALSLYQVVVLGAEVEGLKLEVCRRRQEGQEGRHKGQTDCYKRSSQDTPESEHALTLIRRRRMVSGKEILVSQPCLQFMANRSRRTFGKEFDSEMHTGIPWQIGLRRGSALDEDQDRILIQQEGYYYVYSQVFCKDNNVPLGHVVIRWKATVVGNDAPHVVLFRCIKHKKEEHAFTTCYTGGIVKLEVGDHLELLIPRQSANISLDGEDTFMGAIKLV